MYHSAKCINGCAVVAPDGDVGKLYDLYFDDQHYGIRYMAVDAGSWLDGRCVWASPAAIDKVDWDQMIIYVTFSKQNVETAQDVDVVKPAEVRQSDDERKKSGWPVMRIFPMNSGYFGPSYPYNFPGPVVMGLVPGRMDLAPNVAMSEALAEAEEPPEEPEVRLRSASTTDGYHILAEDGQIGQVKDLLIDDATWAISYLVVSAGSWLSGRTVLVPMELVTEVNWEESAVGICVFKDQIQSSPEYDDSVPITREYESKLYEHYGRPKRWE